MSIFPACDMFHGVKVIRPRTVSDRAADRGTSGQHGQKSIGFGGIPTSIFAARKSQVSIHLPCLPFTVYRLAETQKGVCYETQNNIDAISILLLTGGVNCFMLNIDTISILRQRRKICQKLLTNT